MVMREDKRFSSLYSDSLHVKFDEHVTSKAQRKNLSPREELNLKPSVHRSDTLTNDIKVSFMTCILLTAMISNAEIVRYVINKE